MPTSIIAIRLCLTASHPSWWTPGHAQLYGHVEVGLTSDGITQAPGLVVLTHCHPDHMEAAQALQRLGCRIAMHPREVEYMEGEGRQLAAAMGMPYPDLVVDVLLEEGELKVGEHSLRVLATPGHSPRAYLPLSCRPQSPFRG